MSELKKYKLENGELVPSKDGILVSLYDYAQLYRNWEETHERLCEAQSQLEANEEIIKLLTRAMRDKNKQEKNPNPQRTEQWEDIWDRLEQLVEEE